MYDSSSVPCRINHQGSTKNRIQWDIPLDAVQYVMLIPALADGLRETVHPHAFIARTAFEELIRHIGRAKAEPLLDSIVKGLRAALMSKNKDVFLAGTRATRVTSQVVGDSLNKHLRALLMQLSKRILKPTFRDDVTTTLQELEANGGPPALKQIKSKVPTYTTIFI